MAHLVMAYIVMDYIVMDYIVMAYIVMAVCDLAGRRQPVAQQREQLGRGMGLPRADGGQRAARTAITI